MEHVPSLPRSFPWRTAALVALAIALAEPAALYVLDHRATAQPTGTRQTQTRPGSDPGRVSKATATPLRARSRVSVLVLNGNGIQGAAGAAATRLLHRGYRSATATDAPTHDYAASLVLYRPGWQREAQRLAHDARIRVVAPLDGRLPGGSGRDQLVLILGR